MNIQELCKQYAKRPQVAALASRQKPRAAGRQQQSTFELSVKIKPLRKRRPPRATGDIVAVDPQGTDSPKLPAVTIKGGNLGNPSPAGAALDMNDRIQSAGSLGRHHRLPHHQLSPQQ